MTALNIGILTFHRCINYGSYWQALSLAEGLRQMGYNAVILDHHSAKVNIAEWKCALQPTLPIAVSDSDRQLYRLKIEKFFKAFEALPLSPKFELNDATEISNYDVVIVGSDEVWNLMHPWYKNNSLFFGDGIHTQKLIAYAASFGNYSAWWGLNDYWSKKLQNFDHISVRDENSWYLVHNAIGTEPELVLDPCLTFDVKPATKTLNIDEDYIAVYGHNFSASFISSVKKYAAEKKLSLISIGYRNDWTDKNFLVADPYDFAHFISQSTAVATNFFHGCVFALKNQKPFVCESSHYRSNKIDSLLKMIGGEHHFMNDEKPYATCHQLLSENLNKNFYEKLKTVSQRSTAFLKRAINIQQMERA